MHESLSPLAFASLLCTAISAVILVTYIVARPPLTGISKIWLLMGLGVFPIGAAITGNYEDFEATKSRAFCGSCHVMIPHASDSDDHTSRSLASRHGRNKMFGADNCYACHADYGMFGTVTTKMGGMRHVYLYATEYRDMSLAEAKEKIHLVKPYPNSNCMQCHSTENMIWLAVPDHKASLEDVRAGRVSCASGGCHGFAHPFSKKPEDVDAAERARIKRETANAAAMSASFLGLDGGVVDGGGVP